MPAEAPLQRPVGQLTINAQGLGVSVLSVVSTTHQPELVYLWHGARWLSAPHNPANCTTLCQPATGQCAQSAQYVKGHDFDYWIPLQFEESGNVKQFESFVDHFELNLLRQS